MPAPSPRMNPSRSRSKGRLARSGSSLRVESAVRQDEAGHAEGMDHAVRAAGEDDVGIAAADQLEGLADGLRAGGAGGQAIGVGSPGSEDARQVAGRGSGLLLGFADRVQLLRRPAG